MPINLVPKPFSREKIKGVDLRTSVDVSVSLFWRFGAIPLSFMTSSFPGLFLGKMSKKKPWERGCNSGIKKKCP